MSEFCEKIIMNNQHKNLPGTDKSGKGIRRRDVLKAGLAREARHQGDPGLALVQHQHWT